MKRLLLTLLFFVGCPVQDPPVPAGTCDTAIGKHCGCAAKNCSSPCTTCCDVVPCPPATCGDHS